MTRGEQNFMHADLTSPDLYDIVIRNYKTFSFE